jgi:hypothetical protein
MHRVKPLGQRPIGGDVDRRVAPFQLRAAVRDGLTAPGPPFAHGT